MTDIVRAMALAMVPIALGTPAAAQQRDSRFSGPRVEARIGWDRPVLRATLSDADGSVSSSEGRSGVHYGGEIGYDGDLRNFVLGAYAGLDASSVRTCTTDDDDGRLCLKAGRTINLGLRGGVKASDSILFYAKGGYSNGRLTLDYRGTDLDSPDTRESADFGGFHLGTGVEATLNGGIYSRLEYVYTSYSSRSVVEDEVRFGLTPRRHQVTYSLGYRF